MIELRKGYRYKITLIGDRVHITANVSRGKSLCGLLPMFHTYSSDRMYPLCETCQKIYDKEIKDEKMQ